MKKLSFLLLTLLMLTSFCACSLFADKPKGATDVSLVSIESSHSDESSKVVEEEPFLDSKFTDFGIPLAERYTNDYDSARNVWDMAIYDGFLYVGSGDYDKNSGPCDVWRMNVENGKWELSGTVNDEQVGRFITLNGELVIPGFDSRGDWTYGSYYCLTNDEWVDKRVLPGGVHVYDLIEYDGKVFAGMGAVGGDSAVAVSFDGGASFSSVPMYNGDKLMVTDESEINRVYDLFVIGGKLYALYYNDDIASWLYEYDGAKFVYSGSWNYSFKYTGQWYVSMGAKLSFNKKLFIAAGHLYTVGNDIDSLDYMEIDGVNYIFDMLTENGKLYLLCATMTDDERYLVSVRESATGEDGSFKKIVEFMYDIPARSFALDGNTFYFGMGTLADMGENNGRILASEVSE